jgi:hypothetical protein
VTENQASATPFWLLCQLQISKETKMSKWQSIFVFDHSAVMLCPARDEALMHRNEAD